MLQAVERGNRHLRRVELERLRRHPLDDSRLQGEIERLLVPARARPERHAGRYEDDRSCGGRNVSRHPREPQSVLIRRPVKEIETVVRLAGVVDFEGGCRAVLSDLHADPPQLVRHYCAASAPTVCAWLGELQRVLATNTAFGTGKAALPACDAALAASWLLDPESPFAHEASPGRSLAANAASAGSPGLGVRIISGAAARFLAGLAAFYAILADLRNSLGVTPTTRLK